MPEKIRWGVVGTGNIARKFAEGLRALSDAELVAVGSRTRETAEAFGRQFNVPHRHESYEDLARDGDVDAVYVATPHPMHKDNSLLCLENGKAVLCEKPFTVNASQAQQVVDKARQKGLFLMEAMWTRFLPLYSKVREWIATGAIGEVRMFTADFGFRSGWNPEGRLLNPLLAGGGLLDVGVYIVSLASMIFGEQASRVATLAHIGDSGVDEQAAMVLGYGKGRLASLTCAVRTNTPQEARIIGTDGWIALPPPFWHGDRAIVQIHGKAPQEHRIPFEGNGYNYEAAEVARCLRDGKVESDVMPLDETLQIMQTLDRIRQEWNLHYPME
jgi:predicted dehydrogenase